MLRRLLQCGLLCLAVFALAGAGDPATRFNELGHQMMCICGCNQILLECNHVGCPDSDGMRNELMAAVSRGDSDSLVEQAFVQKYGPTVLAAPTTSGFDRTAWIVPFVALLLGLSHRRPGRSRLEESPRARHRRRPPPRPWRRTRAVPRTGAARRPNYDLRIRLLPSRHRRRALLHFLSPATFLVGPEKTRAAYLRERKDVVYENLRDLNFEFKAGKMPDVDYQSLKSSLQDEAATLLAEIARLEAKAAAAPRKARP